MKTVILDARCMETPEEAHEYIKMQLGLAEYYGANLDALYDCLTELNEMQIQIHNYSEGNIYLSRILGVMLDAQEENSELMVEIEK